jgi:hypothetical protein
MTLYAAPICLGCKHFIGYQRATDAEIRADPTILTATMTGHCDAYKKPIAIPVRIWQSGLDHRGVAPGDNGIRFEAVSPVDAQYAVTLFDERPRVTADDEMDDDDANESEAR